jgi:hypothetical protein
VLESFDVDFASDARNVLMGLATYEFDPFSINSASNSCWLVFAVW